MFTTTCTWLKIEICWEVLRMHALSIEKHDDHVSSSHLSTVINNIWIELQKDASTSMKPPRSTTTTQSTPIGAFADAFANVEAKIWDVPPPPPQQIPHREPASPDDAPHPILPPMEAPLLLLSSNSSKPDNPLGNRAMSRPLLSSTMGHFASSCNGMMAFVIHANIHFCENSGSKWLQVMSTNGQSLESIVILMQMREQSLQDSTVSILFWHGIEPSVTSCQTTTFHGMMLLWLGIQLTPLPCPDLQGQWGASKLMPWSRFQGTETTHSQRIREYHRVPLEASKQGAWTVWGCLFYFPIQPDWKSWRCSKVLRVWPQGLSPFPDCGVTARLPWSKHVTGCKATKDFTVQERGRDKYRYYHRDEFWSKVAELVRAGFTSDQAWDKIYDVYGGNMSVAK